MYMHIYIGYNIYSFIFHNNNSSISQKEGKTEKRTR